MKHKIRNTVLENVTYLVLSSGFTQIINILCFFYISRNLGPFLFGTYQIVLSFVSMFTFLTFDGLNRYVIVKVIKNKEDAKRIIESVVGFKNLCSIISVIICIITLLFIQYDNQIKFYVIIFSFTLILGSLNGNINIIYQANEDFKPIAIINSLGTICRGLFSVLVLFLGYSVLQLLYVWLFVGITTLFLNYYYCKSNYLKFDLFNRLTNLVYNFNSGIFFTLLKFSNMASVRLNIIFLSLVENPSIVGIYALSSSIIERSLIVNDSISLSLFPNYAKYFTSNKKEIVKIFKDSLVISIPSVFFAMIFFYLSDYIILYLAGDKYEESITILEIFGAYLIIRSLIVPWSHSLQVTKNEGVDLLISFIKLITNLVLNIYFYPIYGLIGVVYSVTISNALSFLLTIFFVKVKLFTT